MTERPVSAARLPVGLPVLVTALVLVVVSVPGSVTHARPSGADEAASEAPQAVERPAGDGLRFSAGSVQLSRAWWNRPQHVETLGLTDEQRSAMDALLIDHLEQRREMARQFMERRRELGDLLAAGDWEAADAAADEVGAAWARMARSEADLATRAVRLLEPSQRRLLDQELPMLLRRPWVYGGAGRRGLTRGPAQAPARGGERVPRQPSGGPPGR